MKKLAVVVALLASFAATAAEYTLIVPNPAGSSADVVARTVADEYNQQTGNTLVIDYAPGADHVIAASKFKAATKLTAILSTTTMHVFNHVYKESIPYQDSDFDHVGWIGWSPHVWYANGNSKFKTLPDVTAALATDPAVFVAVDAFSTEINAISVQKKFANGSKLQQVKYKGSPQAMTDVLAGTVNVGIASISELVVANAQAGKIKLLATTHTKPLVIGGETVPAAGRMLGVSQFDGGMLISISPRPGDAEAVRLKDDIARAIASPAVKEKLAKINITVDPKDSTATMKMLADYRAKVSELK